MAITAVVFIGALSGQFLTWDDDHNFLTNMAFRGLDAANLRWMFTTFHLGPYQPLSWLSLGIDYSIWGMDPWGYHLTNLLLHVANAGLAYAVAQRLFAHTGEPGLRTATQLAAAFAALLFAIHPLRVESVAWVTERRDVLSGFFALLTMLAYFKTVDLARVGKSSSTWIAVSVVLFGLSLASKASAMALPAVLILIDWWWLRRWRLVDKIPFAIVSLVAAWLALVGQRADQVMTATWAEGPADRVAHGFYGLVFYIWKSVVPIGLSNLYEVPFRANPFDVSFVLSAIVVLGVTLATFLARARWPAIFVAWLAYVALLLPVSGIAHPGGQIVADRYSYLPCLVFALLAGAGMLALWRARRDGRVHPRIAQLAAVGAAAILVVLGILSVRQIPVWHDSLALWRHAFEQHPLERLRASGAPAADVHAYEARLATLGELSAHRMIALSLGTALKSAGRANEALEVFARGASASPSNADIRNSWAATLLDLRRADEAARLLEASIRLDPTHAEAHFNLALARDSQGRADEAMDSYRRALAIDGNNAVARYNLGVLLAAERRYAEAAVEYRHAIAIRPGYGEAHNNLGVALGSQGLVKEAIEAFRRAVAIDPSNASAVKNLARAIEVSKGGSP